MRKRASAIIIKDKKLLLLTTDYTSYWTPGGRIEIDESPEDTIRREIDEELGILATKLTKYCEFTSKGEALGGWDFPPTEEIDYLVEYKGELTPAAEIKDFIWASRDDLVTLPILNQVKVNVIDRLKSEGLL